MPLQEYGVTLFFFIPALVLAAIAILWLVVRAFDVRALWGLAVLLLPGAVLFFVPMHWKKARAPVLLLLLACLLGAGGLVAGQFIETRDPRVKMVENDQHVKEKHVTLARAKVAAGEEAALLKKHADVVVLQMNDGFATDETLALLDGMNELRELNLNDDPGVTDAGLAHVAKLPKLEILKLNRTAVTDEGFTKYLADLPHLREVQLRGTEVKTSTLRKWKNKGKELNLERLYTSDK